MEKIGKVMEVFLPNDDIESKYIGFKIKFDDEIQEFVVKQNEINCQIMREDMAIVRKQVISGREFLDIELYGNGE